MTNTTAHKPSAAQAWGLAPPRSTQSPDALLTYAQVGDLLGISARSAAKLAASGALKKIQILGSIRFARGDVLALIERSRLK